MATDLLSLDQLRYHAQVLARRHQVASVPRRDGLLARLRQNASVLQEAHGLLEHALEAGDSLPPAGVWLLDNFYVIQDQIRLARQHLPRKYSRELPQLAGGTGPGRPRVYDIVLELIRHADGQVDPESLEEFVKAYQQVTHLRLGELWAIPIMLRLALIENIRRVALRAAGQLHRDPETPAPEKESQAQAADQLSIGNSITSLRSLDALDWKAFVEHHSVVERILREDPARVYAQMSFASRDRYRHVVERIARRSRLNEEQVAQLAVRHARDARDARSDSQRDPGRPARQGHVGYYLVDQGRSRLERDAGYRPTWQERLQRAASRRPLAWYLGSIVAVWLSTVGGAAAGAWYLGLAAAGPLAGLVAMALFAGAATQFALGLVNWLSTIILRPRPVERLDFSKGIPPEYRTLVAVPTLLTSESAVRTLTDQLEMRYLANQDENLLFALLSDFPDADQETLPSDGRLLELAEQEIRRLNQAHCRSRPPAFYLLHRSRSWNPRQVVWMAYERKRGKLAALNRLLRTGSAQGFSATVGDLPRLAGVRYVITLDSDTQLPRDTGRMLVGCMAHPLNQPRLDPETRMVVEGYGILQPRVATTIPEADRSLFSRLYCGDAGIDPYTQQVSDVYQDAFAQGSFIGKGIYDVEAFETALEGRFPENRVLSHDLIEGCFTRSGLVNDLELFEGFPSRLLADMSRRHRWIRGDWQIAAWLAPKVPTVHGSGLNTLSPLSRWKIFDNLRRSLVPVCLLAFLAVGWIAAPALAGFWTVLAVAIVFGPGVIGCLPGLVRKPQEKPWSLHARDQRDSCLRTFAREAIAGSILPYTVHCHLDAIARTAYRLRRSRRRLLEWTTAGEAEVRSAATLRDHYEVMWACTVASLGLATLLAILAPLALVPALPVLLAWLAGPAIAWWISQPLRAPTLRPSDGETRSLRRWARQTWHFFETYVTEQDHWLPPDNVQQRPDWTVAPRTSPTNIGMGLLADLAACDLGYLAATHLAERAANTFHSLQRLERYRGHFYNWYNTRTLEPAEPRYVSSVDSGNLWGALTVLRVAMKQMPDRLLVSPRLVEGVQDTLEVIASLHKPATAHPGQNEFSARLAELRRACGQPAAGARAAWRLLSRARVMAADLAAIAPADPPAVREWTRALAEQCARAHDELSRLAFWIHAPSPTDPQTGDAALDAHTAPDEADEVLAGFDSLDAACTLRQLLRTAESVLNRPPSPRWTALRQAAEQAADAARRELQAWSDLADLCLQFSAMDFRFLFQPERKLLTIGFNVAERRCDNSYYDLLASESRLTSFLAISHGQLPPEHWFALGRIIGMVDGHPALLSWSGSMFEYLMPVLLMPSYRGTLLEASCRAAVRRQIRYAERQGVPWGISESCYNLTDASLAYQYRAFGVPGLGLERGQGANLVIAPYASALAAMVVPRESCANLDRLEQLGYLTSYGFYDAIDYTPQRRLAPHEPAPCRSVMAHHSGMTLLALENVLLEGRMQRRLLADPLCRAHELLLQERVPQGMRPVDPTTLDTRPASLASGSDPCIRVFHTPHTDAPQVHLLGNGRYHLVLTNTGGGLARWKGLQLGGPGKASPGDYAGQFCLLRDVESGESWSNAYLPARRQPDKYEAVFSQGRVEYRAVYAGIDARTEISVSPEDDVEVRRLTLTNLARARRTIELATCADALLAPHGGGADPEDAVQETQWLPEVEALLSIRPGTPGRAAGPCVFHLMQVQQAKAPPEPGGSDKTSLRLRGVIELAAEESASACIITGVAETRETALALIQRYRDPRVAARVFELAQAHSRLTLQCLRIEEADAHRYARLASAMLFPSRQEPHPTSTPTGAVLQPVKPSQRDDASRPVVLVRCSDVYDTRLAEQMLNAHSYWRSKGLEVDLVLWLDHQGGYRHELYQRVMRLVAASPFGTRIDQPGGVFIRRGGQQPPGELDALRSGARISLSDADGPLETQGILHEPDAAG